MCKSTFGQVLWVLFGICFIFSTPALALDHWQNEYLHNGTGQTATDLEKWFDGDVKVSKWLSSRFSSFDYIYISGDDMTKLRWFNGTVNDSQWTTACAKTDKEKIKHRYLPRWTFGKGDSLIAGPALTASFAKVGRGQYALTLSNTAAESLRITVDTAKIAVVDTLFRIEQLIRDSLTFVDWESTVTNTNIPPGPDPIEFPAYEIPRGGAIVYFAKVHLTDTLSSNVVEYVGQFTTWPPGYPGPTLSEWGLIVFAGLFILTLIYVIRRRRAKAAMAA